MSYRRAIRILVVSWVMALCMSTVASAQRLPPPQSPTPAQQTPVPSVAPLIPIYPDSSAGLEKLMKDMLGLEKRGDTQALAPYLQSLVLRNPNAWFKSIFGDTVGTQLTLSYEPTAKWLPQSMAATLKNLRQEGLADHFEVVDFNKPCAAPSFMSIQGDSETKALGSMDAVRQWKYQPTMLNGTPVTVDTCITVIFNLGSR